MKGSFIIVQIMLLALAAPLARAVSTTPEELSEAGRWVAAKFQGKAEVKSAEGYLIVYTASGVVQKNGVSNRQLRILDKVYARGLHCPSVGRVVVHLPSPGKTFDAVVGVDSNDVSYYDNSSRGSIVAAVLVGEKEAFRSAVMREGMPTLKADMPLPVAAQLMRDQHTRIAYMIHNAAGIIYPAAYITYRHIVRHLGAGSEEELKDLGIEAERKSPLEVFTERRDAARRAHESRNKI